MPAAGGGGLEAWGKILVLVGVGLLILGGLVYLAGRAGWSWRPLPGDIVIRKPGLVVFFPIVTMLLISLILTLIWQLVNYLRR